MKCLNPTLASTIYKTLHLPDTAKFVPIVCGDKKTYMLDVNSLALYEDWIPNEVKPSPDIPQFPQSPNSLPLALALEVTQKCNLRCAYCYGADGHMPDTNRATMTLDMAKQAIDLLFDQSMNRKLQIAFFGGEPLLAFPLITHIVAYAKRKFANVSFGITTNATQIDATMADELRAMDFSFVVSLDGPEAIHNEYRSDSWSSTMDGLKYLYNAGLGKRVTLRATYSPRCVQLLERFAFLNDLCDRGFARNVSIEPAFLSEGCGFKMKGEASYREEQELEHAYFAVADAMISRKLAGKAAHFQNIDVYAQRLLYRQYAPSTCGAGVGYMSVSATGKIYPCHRQTTPAIGDLRVGGIDERARCEWLDNRVYACTDCSTCPFTHICGGPCRELSYRFLGKTCGVNPMACEIYKLWIRAAVKMLAGLPDLERYAYVPRTKKASTVHVTNKANEVSLLREGGGFGDIISLGGAAQQIKKERPDTRITAYIPSDFICTAKHLQGIDDVIGLGSLTEIRKNRRAKNAPIDRQRYSYLTSVPQNAIDLWCPAKAYEMGAVDRLEYTRSQIFAHAAVCKDDKAAIPKWNVTDAEREDTSHLLEGNDESLVIGIAPRGTQIYRSMPCDIFHALTTQLVRQGYRVIVFDSILYADLPEGVRQYDLNFLMSVALASQCDGLITVDSAFMHVGAALSIPTLCFFGPTDPAPYLSLYPTLIGAFDEGRREGQYRRCVMPCNRAEQKGFIPEICDQINGCARMCTTLQKWLDPILFSDFRRAMIDPIIRARRLAK